LNIHLGSVLKKVWSLYDKPLMFYLFGLSLSNFSWLAEQFMVWYQQVFQSDKLYAGKLKIS